MMNVIWLFLLFLNLGSTEGAIIASTPTSRQWEIHKEKYGLSFNDDEDLRRKEIFDKNLLFINDMNAEGRSFTLGMNHLGHLTEHEIAELTSSQRYYNTRSDDAIKSYLIKPGIYNATAPDEFDWRSYEVVGQVKNQINCSSGYAFAAVASLESAYALDTGNFIELSEQDAIDCTLGKNKGCMLGSMRNVFIMAILKGIATTESYPYMGESMPCRHSEGRLIYGFRGITEIYTLNEAIMKLAIAVKGPISISFDASEKDFKFYHSGIYNSTKCSRSLEKANHAATIVGYGIEGNKEYYIVKNSWGVDWGMKGFFKIARNCNTCGIANQPLQPVR